MSTAAAASASSRQYQISVAVPFSATRDQMWCGLIDKIRIPGKYVDNRRNVKILEDTPTYVRRYMEAGPEDAPIVIQEKITWDESASIVTYTSEDNPQMTGSVQNKIETAADGSLSLRLSFDWHFTDAAPETAVGDMAKMLDEATVQNIANKIISVVEGKVQ